MNPKTKVVILTFISLCFLCLFVPLDFIRILIYRETYHISFEVVRVLKLMVSFISFILAITSNKSCLNSSDYFRISISFCVIFWGDIFFTLGLTALGVITFAVGQTLLIFRNSKGLKNYLKREFPTNKLNIILSGVVILLLDIVILIVLFFRTVGITVTTVGFSIYSIVLCSSVWIALLSRKVGYFSDKSSNKIAFGMILFFLCDLTVGYGIILESVTLKEIVTSLTWIFYTPALLLLSISSYNFKHR